MRLIDADAATECLKNKLLEIQRSTGISFKNPRFVEIIYMIKWIQKQPTVESKVGHWILKQSTDSGITHWECSECKTTNYTGYTNYCPVCGAKMK